MMERNKIARISIVIIIICLTAVVLYKLFIGGMVYFESLNTKQKEYEHKGQVTLHFICWNNFSNKIFNSFNDKYPNINVEFEQYGRQHYQDVQRVRISSGENIDLMEVMEDDYINFAKSGYLLDITKKGFLNNYNQSSLQELAQLRKDKKIFSVPYKSYVFGIWYNKILFNKYYIKEPKNYEEFLSACRILKSNNIAPMVIGCKDEWLSSYILYLRILNVAGNDNKWFNKINSGEIHWSSPEILKEVQEVEKLIKKGYILQDSIRLTYQQAFYEFTTGHAAMCLLGDWSLDLISPDTEKVCDPGVFPIAYNDDNLTRMVPGTRAGFLISIFSKTPHRKETENLLEYLSRTETAQVYTNETKSSSTVKNVSFKEVKLYELWEPLRNRKLIAPLTSTLPRDMQGGLNRSAKELMAGLKTSQQILEDMDRIN